MNNEGAKFLALVHVVIAAVGFNYFQSLESRPLPWSTIVFGLVCAWPPILAAYGGARITAGPRSEGLLFLGIAIAVAIALLACISVVTATGEPLAALLLIFVTLGQIIAFPIWLALVWSVARSERAA